MITEASKPGINSKYVQPHNAKLNIKVEDTVKNKGKSEKSILSRPNRFQGVTAGGQPKQYRSPDTKRSR